MGAVFRSETWGEEEAQRATRPIKPLFMGERMRQGISTNSEHDYIN